MSTKYIIDNKAEQTITGDLLISGSQSISGNLTVSGVINATIGMSYSIYRALLTQTGALTGTASGAFGGALILGEVYTIVNYENGDDFSNMFTLSETANETGSFFVATEPFPLSWDAASLLTSDGGVVANVLENNLGFDITWDWTPLGGTGYYFASNGGAYDLIIGETTTTFPREKTTSSCSAKYSFGQDGGMPMIPIISNLSFNNIDDGLVLEMFDLVDTGAMVDNALYYNLVEIKIYQ